MYVCIHFGENNNNNLIYKNICNYMYIVYTNKTEFVMFHL